MKSEIIESERAAENSQSHGMTRCDVTSRVQSYSSSSTKLHSERDWEQACSKAYGAIVTKRHFRLASIVEIMKNMIRIWWNEPDLWGKF